VLKGEEKAEETLIPFVRFTGIERIRRKRVKDEKKGEKNGYNPF